MRVFAACGPGAVLGYRSVMKTIWFGLALAAALLLAACSKKDDKGGAAAGDPCETAINQAVDKMLAKGNQDARAPTPMLEIANKLRAIMTERCKADSWSESALACFRAATDQPSIKACRQGLPPEQSQRLQADIMKVMTSGGRPGGPGGMGGMGGPPHGGGPGGPPHGGGGPAGGAAAPSGDGAAPGGSGATPSGSGAPATGSAN